MENMENQNLVQEFLFTLFGSFYQFCFNLQHRYEGAFPLNLNRIFSFFLATYDRNHDTFRIEILLIPSVILALLINHEFTIFEVLWTFSIYLEAVAIMPQLFMLSRTGAAETITAHYLFALGSYRGLYILNWVYRYYMENHLDVIALVAGVAQTVLYADFFYLYITRVVQQDKKLKKQIRELIFLQFSLIIHFFGMNKCSLFSFILILFISSVISNLNENSELILVQAIWRHGDRSPTKTFKTDKYQEENWPQGWGQLTPLGMAQHVELGQKLRKRYIQELNFVAPRYNSHEIYVRSTDWNRTLTSAISNFIGFYGPGSGEDYPKDLGPNNWPGWYVPIAIHSLPGTEDFMAPSETNCTRLRLTPEYNQSLNEFKWLLDLLSEKTEQKVDPFDMWMIDDAFYIEVVKLKGKPLVDWAEGNQTILDSIKELDYIQDRWTFGLGLFPSFLQNDLKPLGDANFRQEFSRILGGPILWKFITNMKEKLACLHRMNAVKEIDREIKGRTSPLGAPLCKWMNKMKYFAYSAHDSTLSSLFSALGFPKTNYDEDGYPHYSTCVTFELWRGKNTGEFNVKVILWKPSATPKEITKDIEGCQNSSTLEQFIKRSEPYKMLPSPKDYCSQLLKPLNGANNLINWKLKMLLLLAFFTTIFFTKKKLSNFDATNLRWSCKINESYKIKYKPP
ncbi:hypothetical protein Mgra_00006083 [Meloidogyne graminicola]|uniref:ER lumen protein-retaining receptor n=1 Tax=Meloidogyne graminicola TaxID=189291 RepID=A0A8S9ZMS7_9BILA|nr:hypothetical protein Mgra_00006083 [Meloidogyne graminicola]